MPNPLPIDQRISVDEAPLREWLARTPELWAKRLERHALTGESLDSQGISLGERVVRVCRCFSDPSERRQDEKLIHLLGSCQDPRSAASVWLRAVLPWTNGSLSRQEELDCLSERLKEKLDHCGGEDRLAWATLALRAAARICKPQDRTAVLSKEDDAAMTRVISAAWVAIPMDLTYRGRSMLPAQQISTSSSAVPWKAFHLHLIEMLSYRQRNSPSPSALLPVQLWMAPDFDSLTLMDQKAAQTHFGLVPDSMIGHRAFLDALQNGTPWPDDPRVAPMVEWLKTHNAYLAPLAEAVALQQNTPSAETQARVRARL